MASVIALGVGALATALTGTAVSAGVLSATAAAFIVAGSQVLGTVLASHLSSDGEEAVGADNLSVNTISGQRTIPVLYGEHRVGGNDLFIGTTDDSVVILQGLCEGKIKGIKEIPLPDDDDRTTLAIFLNGQPIYEFDTTWYVRVKTGTEGLPYTDKYEKRAGNKVATTVMKGEEDQTAIEWVTDLFPEADDNYINLAYIAFRVKAEGASSLQKREVIVEGKIVKNFTVAGDPEVYSRNAVLILYDYLTNTRYGLGWKKEQIDKPSWISAYNYVNLKGLEINFAVTGEMKSQAVIDNILKYFNGELSWWNDKIYLSYRDIDYETESFNITDKDIQVDENGPMLSINQADRTSVIRNIRVRYMVIDDPDVTSSEAPTYNFFLDDFILGEAKDSSLDQKDTITQLDCPGFFKKKHATSLGTYVLKRSEFNRTYSMSLRPENIEIAVGDLGTINIDCGPEIRDQKVRAIQSNTGMDGSCSMVFLREDDEIYEEFETLDKLESLEDVSADYINNPPPVTDVVISEETYHYRLRSYSRVVVEYSIPTDKTKTPHVDYSWFSHADINVAFDPYISDDDNPDNPDEVRASFADPWIAVYSGPNAAEYANNSEPGDIIYLLDSGETYHIIENEGNGIKLSSWEFGFDRQQFRLIKRDSLKTISGSKTRAMIDPAEEGKTYYIAPISVSTSGAVQDYGTETMYEYTVDGVSKQKPIAIEFFSAGFNAQGLTYSILPSYLDKGVDVYGYELRRGFDFSTGVKIASTKTGGGVIADVLPPSNKNSIWASAVGDNGLYASTPFRLVTSDGDSDYMPMGSSVAASKPLTLSIESSENIEIPGGYTLRCAQTDGNLHGYAIFNPITLFDPPRVDKFPNYTKGIYLELEYGVSTDNNDPYIGPALNIETSVSFIHNGVSSHYVGNATTHFVSGVGSQIRIRIDITDPYEKTHSTVLLSAGLRVYQRMFRWSDFMR